MISRIKLIYIVGIALFSSCIMQRNSDHSAELLFPPPEKEEAVMIEGPPASSFDARFPNPIVSGIGSYPGGIELVSVYDRSQQAEDPLIPELWLFLDSGERLPRNAGSIEQALRISGHSPSNEEEVWALILLALYPGFGTNSLILPDFAGSNADSRPFDALSRDQAWPPQIVQDSDGFRVKLLQYSIDSNPVFFKNPPHETLFERRFIIAEGRFEMQTYELWSRGGLGHAVSSPGSDPGLIGEERESYARAFSPAPEPEALVLSRAKEVPVVVNGRYARLEWTFTSLEESEMGPAFNVVVQDRSRNILAEFAITERSRPVELGDFIIIGRIKNKNAFHREPHSMRLVLTIHWKPAFLLRSHLLPSPEDEVIISKGSTRTPLELLDELSVEEKMEALIRLRYIPGLNRDGVEVRDMEQFIQFLKWVISKIPRKAARDWLDSQSISHPFYTLWLGGGEEDSADIQPAVSLAARNPDLFIVALKIALDNRSSAQIGALEEALNQVLQRFGLVDPPAEGMESHMKTLKRWQEIQSEMIPRAKSMLEM